MTISRTTSIGRLWLTMLLGATIAIAGCNQPGKGDSERVKQKPARSDRTSERIIRKNPPASPAEGTELWLFGVSTPDLTKPFSSRGVRIIVDLRTINTQKSIGFMKSLAERDLGLAICLRWKNTQFEGDRPRGRENFDIPPSTQESSRALGQLREILGSDAAKRIGSRLYVEIYNEIGGGPGRYAPEHQDEMMAFADRLVPVIRSANPQAKICGPALSGQQLHQYGNQPGNQANRVKSEMIEKWIKWTVKNADVTDVHLNGIEVDDKWADTALANMRAILDAEGGQHIGLVSLEWSCSGYPNRNDPEGMKRYIHTLWETMQRHKVQVAAYTYWPLLNMPEEMRGKTSWASVIGEDQKPNQPVWEALVSIGKGEK